MSGGPHSLSRLAERVRRDSEPTISTGDTETRISPDVAGPMAMTSGQDLRLDTVDTCPKYRGMNIAILENLGLTEVEFGPGTVLIQKGVEQKNVYVMILGKIDVRSGDQRLAVLDAPGAILGEVVVLLGSVPIATVTTLEKSSFFVIPDFLEFIHKHPEACVSVAQTLASRLVATNNHLVFIKEQLQTLQETLQDYVPAFPDQSS